jgi:hypothetical protein
MNPLGEDGGPVGAQDVETEGSASIHFVSLEAGQEGILIVLDMTF